MSTTLIVLASILAFFALVLIPLMMSRSGTQDHRDRQQPHGSRRGKGHGKRKKR